jgi:uncharacterized OB-fold protein
MTETMTLTFDFPMSELDVHFFDALRAAELRGVVCEDCDLCYVPPRRRCPKCLGEMSLWRVLSAAGTVEAITVVAYRFAGLPDPPYALAYVQPDGADSCILNYVEMNESVRNGSLTVGDRVDIRFKDDRDGSITDFYFATQ